MTIRSNSGHIRIEGANICYTDNNSGKHTLDYDQNYSTSVGSSNAGYIWLDSSDLLRIYYVDEYGDKRRTEASEDGGETVDSGYQGYTRAGENDNYLWFINSAGRKRKISGTVAPIPTNDYLYFEPATANGCTIMFQDQNGYNAYSFEYSSDGNSWSDYTLGTTVSLSSGQKWYIRNKSATPVNLDGYRFEINGQTNSYGDLNYMLCQDSTTTLPGEYCLYGLFANSDIATSPKLPATTLTKGCYEAMFEYCPYLTTPPQLPATTLAEDCYAYMFDVCLSLTTLPELPATTLAKQCYYQMFNRCSNIKLSTTQVGDYQTAYRIPTTGTGTTGVNSLLNMFAYTGGTFTGTPTINTTYYTSNTVI